MPVCQWPECNATDLVARGLCQRDYVRAKRAGALSAYRAEARTCLTCGAQFATGKNGKHSYCSATCQKRSFNIRRRESKPDSYCATCAELLPKTSRADARHCSTACQQAAWYEANQEACRQQMRSWKRDNPDRVADLGHRRRALMRSSAVGPVDYEVVRERTQGKCHLCDRLVDLSLKYPDPQSRSWDHIIPISKGGGHVQENVALSHLRCNVSKGAKLLPA